MADPYPSVLASLRLRNEQARRAKEIEKPDVADGKCPLTDGRKNTDPFERNVGLPDCSDSDSDSDLYRNAESYRDTGSDKHADPDSDPDSEQTDHRLHIL